MGGPRAPHLCNTDPLSSAQSQLQLPTISQVKAKVLTEPQAPITTQPPPPPGTSLASPTPVPSITPLHHIHPLALPSTLEQPPTTGLSSISVHFCPQEISGIMCRHFCCYNRGDAPGIWWVEAREAGQHPAMHRAAPQ